MKPKSALKYTSFFIAGAICATVTSAYAEDGLDQIQALLRTDIKIVANGQDVTLDNPSISYNGKTYLYLRDMGKAIGADVQWNQEKRQVEVITQQPQETIPEQQSETTDEGSKDLTSTQNTEPSQVVNGNGSGKVTKDDLITVTTGD